MTGDISFADWKKLDMRVAQIKKAEDHPNAQKLVVMDVDLGNETRKVVAGLKGHYSNEDLIGSKVIIFTNLEQKELRELR